MKPKKTIAVESLRTVVNSYLASDHSTPERRIGAFVILQDALHAANRYKGYAMLERGDQKFDYVASKWNVVDDTLRYYF
jgi:hypothetical protein